MILTTCINDEFYGLIRNRLYRLMDRFDAFPTVAGFHQHNAFIRNNNAKGGVFRKVLGVSLFLGPIKA